MANAGVETSWIRDVVRNSKIQLDILLKPDLELDSFIIEGNRYSEGRRHNLYRDIQLVDGAFPHTFIAEVGGCYFQQAGGVRERDKSRVHGWNRKEALIHEGYNRYGESDSLIAKFKRNLPEFDGFWHVENLLTWIEAIDDFFEEASPLEHLKCKIVWYKMKGAAYYWWKQLQRERIKHSKEEIISWPRMRGLLITRFAPGYCSTKYPAEVYKDSKAIDESSSADNCKVSKRRDDSLVSLGHDVTTDKEAQVVKANDGTEEDTEPNHNQLGGKFQGLELLSIFDVCEDESETEQTLGMKTERDIIEELVDSKLHLNNTKFEQEVSTTASHSISAKAIDGKPLKMVLPEAVLSKHEDNTSHLLLLDEHTYSFDKESRSVMGQVGTKRVHEKMLASYMLLGMQIPIRYTPHFVVHVDENHELGLLLFDPGGGPVCHEVEHYILPKYGISLKKEAKDEPIVAIKKEMVLDISGFKGSVLVHVGTYLKPYIKKFLYGLLSKTNDIFWVYLMRRNSEFYASTLVKLGGDVLASYMSFGNPQVDFEYVILKWECTRAYKDSRKPLMKA